MQRGWARVCALGGDRRRGGAAACSRSAGRRRTAAAGGSVVSAPSTTAPGAPRPGMVWIPAGVLHAGSALDEVPRVADVEPPGVDVPLGGFYIDVLPVARTRPGPSRRRTSRATRPSALCESKGKRLCSELEWERACKGPSNTRYEYGATYDAHVCGAGRRRRRPRRATRAATRRRAGAASACARCTAARGSGPTRRGTAAPRPAGADVGRRPRRQRRRGRARDAVRVREAGAPPASRSPATGFRCCAGPRNDAEVQLDVKVGAGLREDACTRRARRRRSTRSEGASCGPPLAPAPCSLSRAWTWRPAPNVELSLGGRLPRARPERALRHRRLAHAGRARRRRWRRSTRAARSPRSCWSRGWTGASACAARTCRASSSARSSSATAAST